MESPTHSLEVDLLNDSLDDLDCSMKYLCDLASDALESLRQAERTCNGIDISLGKVEQRRKYVYWRLVELGEVPRWNYEDVEE